MLNFVPFLDKYEYIAIEEREIPYSDATVFYVHPLSVRSHLEVSVAESNIQYGLSNYIWLRDCLMDWSNFGDIKFSETNINKIPINIQKELVDYIKMISIPANDVIDELRFLVRWGNYIHDSQKRTDFKKWECKICIEENLQRARNCPLLSDEQKEKLEDFKEATAKYMMGNKKIEGFKLFLGGGIIINECPVPRNNHVIKVMMSVINYCENMKINPYGKGLFSESYYFMVCYNTVMSESGQLQSDRIEDNRIKAEQEQNKNKNKNKNKKYKK